MQTRGERFFQSLKDGRNVWLDGRKVGDLPAPAFAGTLRTIGKLLDQLDDAKVRDEIGFPVEETGVYAQSSFLVPRTPADLARRSRAFVHWARETSGVMSRLSDFARSLCHRLVRSPGAVESARSAVRG